MEENKYQLATLGGGCFWCIEAVYNRMIGILKTQSGYMGGHVENPRYKDVCSGTTGHVEIVQLTFDPSIISYAEILEVFWTIHDPTTLNRQGNDSGTQYRSEIFYHSNEQKKQALQSINEVAGQLYDDPIVTKVTAVDTFYPAENYHNDYYDRNSYAPYCRIVISPKVSKFRQKHAHLIKEETNHG